MEFEYLKRQTCAGIVLFNPDIDKLRKNINSLITQVDRIVLINNNSKNINDVLKMIGEFESEIVIVNNSENMGIAKALNQILDFAVNKDYHWYITMDQDSCCSDNLVFEYAKVLDTNIDSAVLCPYVLNNGKETVIEYKSHKMEPVTDILQPIDCITSGSLCNTRIAQSILGYNNELFIDCVDVDFNARMLLLNKKILRVNTCYLIQYMGESKPVWLINFLYKITKKNIFRRLRFTPIYGDLRIYYIFRNSRIMWNKYGKLAGKKMSKRWMRFQFVYYFFTYPLSYNRMKMVQTYCKAIKDSKMVM